MKVGSQVEMKHDLTTDDWELKNGHKLIIIGKEDPDFLICKGHNGREIKFRYFHAVQTGVPFLSD